MIYKKTGFLTVLLLIFTFTSAAAQNQLEFKHIFSDQFDTKDLQQVSWIEEGAAFTHLKDNEIRAVKAASGATQVLLSGGDYKVGSDKEKLQIKGYEFSPDERFILVKTNVDRIWRRSTKADYYVYDRKKDSLRKLTDKKDKIQYAHFAPAGLKVGFVYRNNLYVKDLIADKEIQITHDGKENKIINGSADWVYEEEFSFAKAWFWSPDGQRVAFYRFDVRAVPQYTIPLYHGPDQKYPEMLTYKYPRPGEANSTVKIGVYDLPSDSIRWMDVGAEHDQYIVRVDWTASPDTLAVRRMNRLQNKQDLLWADPLSGQTKIARTKKSGTWIDENDALTFLENQPGYLFFSESSGYNHIYWSSMDGGQMRQVTRGDWEVTRLVGYDEKQRRVYYVSTEESPLERHLYSIRLDGSNKKQLTSREGWHDVTVGSDYRYFIDQYSNAGQPPEYVLQQVGTDEARKLLDNEKVAQLKDKFGFPDKSFHKIKLKRAGTLNAYMIKPDDFDSEKKYPVLMYVYGGPGSQTVTKSYEEGQRARWHAYLAQQGYIIFSLDNRGTGARGRDFEKQVYKQLGKFESVDQIAAAKYLANKTYVDENRIGIWGWSYGGYMTSLVLGKGGKVFETGIAVAPVTHWKFYDTIYTERFMQTPGQNPNGYKQSSPLQYAENIQADFLLMHGTADDNVHFQNSVELVEELVQHGIEFDTHYYPNRDHSLVGNNTRKHLYREMTKFIQNHL